MSNISFESSSDESKRLSSLISNSNSSFLFGLFFSTLIGLFPRINLKLDSESTASFFVNGSKLADESWIELAKSELFLICFIFSLLLLSTFLLVLFKGILDEAFKLNLFCFPIEIFLFWLDFELFAAESSQLSALLLPIEFVILALVTIPLSSLDRFRDRFSDNSLFIDDELARNDVKLQLDLLGSSFELDVVAAPLSFLFLSLVRIIICFLGSFKLLELSSKFSSLTSSKCWPLLDKLLGFWARKSLEGFLNKSSSCKSFFLIVCSFGAGKSNICVGVLLPLSSSMSGMGAVWLAMLNSLRICSHMLSRLVFSLFRLITWSSLSIAVGWPSCGLEICKNWRPDDTFRSSVGCMLA